MTEQELTSERFGLAAKGWTAVWVQRYVRSQERIAEALEELLDKWREQTR